MATNDGAVHEKEAEHTAAHVTSTAGGCGCRCAACARKTGPQPSPLDPGVRGPLAGALGANLDAVRVREDAAASRLHAAAFTQGDDITFAPGRYRPDTADGRHLIAHEVTHTLQQRANPPHGLTPARRGAIQRDSDGSTADVQSIAVTVSSAVLLGNIGGAVAPLRGRSLDDRKAIRQSVITAINVKLEHWFVDRINQARTGFKEDVVKMAIGGPLVVLSFAGVPELPHLDPDVQNGTAEEGLRLMWRAAPLIDRLEVYDEAHREIEQAQLDVIRAASKAERAEAVSHATRDRLEHVLGLMNAREEYEARGLLDPSEEARLETATSLLKRRDADPLFDAILDLAPAARQQFVMIDHSEELLNHVGRQDYTVLVEMARGDDVEALIARLRLATEDRKDDQEAVSAVIDRAVALVRERRALEAALAGPKLIGRARTEAQLRAQQLLVLDQLLQFEREPDGTLKKNSFMQLVASARDDSRAFAADAQRLAGLTRDSADAKRYAFEVAKQRILIAGATIDSIRSAILQLHAPRPETAPDKPIATAAQQQSADEALRRELLADDAVAAVIRRLVPSEQMRVESVVGGDQFDELLGQLNDANHSGRYGELFHLAFVIARNEGWRVRFRATRNELWSAYSFVFGRPRELMELILAHPEQLPLRAILDYLDNETQLKAVLDDIGEEQRTELRIGWYLTEHPEKRRIDRLTKQESDGLDLYQTVRARLGSSQTSMFGSLDNSAFLNVMEVALGTEPTETELESGEGRYRAALLWYEAQQKRLGLERGISAEFTETDETMEGAGREYAALWREVSGRGTLSNVDFYALASLHQRFEKRSGEFIEASNAISEMASTIAATVAGLIVVVATGGAATPGVIALAAVAGGGTRVITREMFGADYYTAMGSQGARDALLGSIDGALAVVSGSLAAKGANLLGLGGHALTAQAARVAGEVAEEATQSFGRRVAGSSVEAAIDGAFSGAVSEAFGAMTDERNWRNGLMEGMARVGEAALLGGLTGAVGGAVLGAALPVLGRGGKMLWSTVTGRTLERTLDRAGMTDTLKAARAAARSGEPGSIEKVEALATRLEAHLEPSEITALRQELGAELRATPGRPPGTATASKQQAHLIDESATIPAPSGEHLEAELDVVGRSAPQPSREPGYVDEVELENGHVWRREPEGTWCRFSAKTLCGTKPRKSPAMSDAGKRRARIVVAEKQLEAAQTEVERLANLHREYNAIVDRLGAQAKAGERVDLLTLSADEQEVLADVIGEDLEDVTRRDLQQYRERPKPTNPREVEKPSPMERDLHEAAQRARLAEQKLGEVRQSFYDKLRARSPGSARDRIISRAKGRDFVSDAQPFSGALECDHIVPLREIADMPGFEKLDWTEQVAIANYEPNLKAVDADVNNFRQNRSWGDDFQMRGKYSQPQLDKIIAYENTMRKELQDEIDKLLVAKGIPVTP